MQLHWLNRCIVSFYHYLNPCIMSIRKTKEQIIGDIAIQLTFDGGLRRSRVYIEKQSTPNKRKEFRHYLRKELRNLMEGILDRENYSDNDHYRTIVAFSVAVSRHSKYRHFLAGNALRIGTAQKLINLYWKMNWVLKPKFPQPIHCPFDSIIIKKLDRSVHHIHWTQFEDINDYKKLVEAARKKAGALSIAEWELETYKMRTIPDRE